MYTIAQHFVTFICLHCRLFRSFSTFYINRKYTQASYGPQINTSLFSFNPCTVHLCVCAVISLLLHGELEIWRVYVYITSSVIQYMDRSRREQVSQVVLKRMFVSVHLSLCLANLLRPGPFFPCVIYSFSWPPCYVYDGTISGFHLVARYCLAQYEQVQIPTYVV